MRIPSFSRQSGTTTAPGDDRPTMAGQATARDQASAVPARLRSDDPTIPAHRATADRPTAEAPRVSDADRAAAEAHTQANRARREADRANTDRAGADRVETDADRTPTAPPVIAGPKPRASLLATLGLLTGTVSALLVLSGPLAGYGVGLAALALILSLGGISATGRRHVAGKTDALIGMALALGAIVVGVLALTGSLPWLGTDMDTVSRLRNWLDATFVNRF